MNLNLRNRPFSRIGIIGVGVIIFVLLALFLVSFLIEEPLRSHVEKQVNQSLTGYSVHLQKLDFHLIGLSITLKELVIRQEAHPDPPVASFPCFMPTFTGALSSQGDWLPSLTWISPTLTLT